MSNAMLCTIDSDTHTLSASPALVAEFPVHYLQQPGSTLSARSTSLATQYIYGEMSASVAVNAALAALLGQFTSGATIRVRLYSGAGRVGMVYDSGALPAAPKGGKWFHVFTGTSSFRSYEFIVIDTGNPLGYHQFSRLVIGAFLQPDINIQPDFSYLRNTTSSQTRMSDGSLKGSAGGSFSEFAFEFAHLSESERAEVDVFVEAVGLHKDFFFALRPTHGRKYDFASVVMFSEIPPIQMRYFQHYGAAFKVSEALGGNVAVAAVVTPPAPPVVIPPGQGGEGTENGYWIARLNGKEGVSSLYQVASNGNGIIVALKGQDTVQRSTDYGLTYTEFTVAGLLATDIQWTGQYFCGCDALGIIYYSADGANWTAIDSGAGYRLDRISGVDDVLIAAGERIYVYDISAGVFSDETAFAGWTENGCAAVLYSADGAWIFALSASSTRIYRYEVATGVMIPAWTPYGISGVYEMAIFAYNWIAAKLSNGHLYVSGDGGISFTHWLSPPPEYEIHDILLTRRPELLVIMERADGDARWRRVFDSLGGAFIELAVRITYAGRQMLIQENSRVIQYEIVDSTGGTLDTGIDTGFADISAVDSTGAESRIEARINGGIVTYAASPNFTGTIRVAINTAVFQG